jgi:hypothetical protein
MIRGPTRPVSCLLAQRIAHRRLTEAREFPLSGSGVWCGPLVPQSEEGRRIGVVDAMLQGTSPKRAARTSEVGNQTENKRPSLSDYNLYYAPPK